MTLSRRLIVTVAASVGVAIIGVALAMGLLARDALIEQAENQARLVAGLIASEANRAELTADEIDSMIVSQMEALALALAHRLDAAAAVPAERSNLRPYFSRVTADSIVDDIWLLDETGTPLVRVVEGLDQGDTPDLVAAGIDLGRSRRWLPEDASPSPSDRSRRRLGKSPSGTWGSAPAIGMRC